MNRIFLSCLVCLLLVSSAAFAVPSYTITDLGAGLTPTCLSKSGVIAGVASDGRAFLYSPSAGTTFVNSPSGYSRLTPSAVNDSGEFIGEYYNNTDKTYLSFVYKPGNGVVELTAPFGGTNTVCDINSAGLVVGYTSDVDYNRRTYTANTSGVMADLDSSGQTGEVEAMSVNDSGALLSCRYECDYGDRYAIFTHAFVQANGSALSLNSLTEIADYSPGLKRKVLGANDINSLGQIVGMMGVYEELWGDPGIGMGCIGGDPLGAYYPVRAFLYTPGSAPIDLGALLGYDSSSEAIALNDLGQVVGYSEYIIFDGGSRENAFVYSDGKMYDLNTLIAGSANGWVLGGAYNINNKGQILAYAQKRIGNDWVYKSLLLTPAVPEPSSMAALFSGLATGAFYFGRKKRSC